jgi:thiosulfate/3-mercaptopyruvate sulfurtransferase
VTGYAKDALVTTQWVHDHLDTDDVRIVEVDERPALYADGHVPGAIGLDWRADLNDPVQRDLPAPEALARLLGDRGISSRDTIVLYGDRNNWFAAYAYWCLTYYGHASVRLMDGPREKWIAERRPLTRAVPDRPAETFTAGPGDTGIRAFRDDVLAALGTPTRLLDVRSRPEFSGALPAQPGYERERTQRGGHIPGAISIPWSEALRPGGTFKPAEQLWNRYGPATDDGNAPLVTYSRVGARAAHTWFVLHELLGYTDVKLYDGSWSEWGNLVAVPIETTG